MTTTVSMTELILSVTFRIARSPRATGTRAAKAAGMEAHHFEEKEALTKYLTATAHRGDVIWCKASHGMALEEVIAAFYRDYHA